MFVFLLFSIWVNMLKSYIISGSPQSSSSITPSWLDLLGHVKQGVSTVDFDVVNNTVVQLGDGDNVVLECKVFLRQGKAVSTDILIQDM